MIMTAPLRWAVFGPGHIARKFAHDLNRVEGAELSVVASRDLARAETFAQEFGAARAYGSYEEGLADPEIDVVYIATPHPGHLSLSLAALDHGHAVLCEKPVTVNAAEFRQVRARADACGVFFMEGMWTRFFPVMEQVRRWLRDGRIGTPRLVQADFGFAAEIEADTRLWNLELGGGALLDVGIYPLAFSTMVLGTDCDEIKACGHLGETGVDEQTSLQLHYPEGAMAQASCAIRTQTSHEAVIWGTRGSIHLPAPFWRPSRCVLKAGDEEEGLEQPFEGFGFQYEIEHVHECLRRDAKESPLFSMNESLRLQEIMDEVRRQIGLVYPMD